MSMYDCAICGEVRCEHMIDCNSIADRKDISIIDDIVKELKSWDSPWRDDDDLVSFIGSFKRGGDK